MTIERILLRTEVLEECRRLTAGTKFAREYLRAHSRSSVTRLFGSLQLRTSSGDLESTILYFASWAQIEPRGAFVASEAAISQGLANGSDILRTTLQSAVPQQTLQAAIVVAIAILRELREGMNGWRLSVSLVRI